MPEDIVRRLFRFGLITFIVRQDAVCWVGEPDCAIGLHDDIIRGVQPLALITVGQHRAAAVEFGAGYRTAAMLAGHKPALPVARIAVGIVGWLAEHGHLAVRRQPHHAFGGNVGEQKHLHVGKPDRPFRPLKAGGHLVQMGIGLDQRAKARIDDLIRICLAHREPSFPAAAATMVMMMTPVMMSLTPAPNP